MDKERGKRHGGARFPRYDVKKMASHAKLLVSKTRTTPVPAEELATGVLGHPKRTSSTDMKAAALKAYGLVTGTRQAYQSTELAAELAMAEGPELPPLYCRMLLHAKVFQGAWKACSGRTLTRAKLGSTATTSLGVAPENEEAFVEVFLSSAQAAGLCTVDGEQVTFDDMPEAEEEADGQDGEAETREAESLDDQKANPSPDEQGLAPPPAPPGAVADPAARANVQISIDEHMDPEKLERNLQVLRKFGIV